MHYHYMFAVVGYEKKSYPDSCSGDNFSSPLRIVPTDGKKKYVMADNSRHVVMLYNIIYII